MRDETGPPPKHDKPLCAVPGCLIERHRTHYTDVGDGLIAGVDLCVSHWMRATETPTASGQSQTNPRRGSSA